MINLLLSLEIFGRAGDGGSSSGGGWGDGGGLLIFILTVIHAAPVRYSTTWLRRRIRNVVVLYSLCALCVALITAPAALCSFALLDIGEAFIISVLCLTASISGAIDGVGGFTTRFKDRIITSRSRLRVLQENDES